MGAQTGGMMRRHRSKQERRQIVEESLKPNGSVTRLAASLGIRSNQIYHWRKLYREGRLGSATPATLKLLPVQITETAFPSGCIRLEIGEVRLCIEGPVDHESLRILLEHVTR